MVLSKVEQPEPGRPSTTSISPLFTNPSKSRKICIFVFPLPVILLTIPIASKTIFANVLSKNTLATMITTKRHSVLLIVRQGAKAMHIEIPIGYTSYSLRVSLRVTRLDSISILSIILKDHEYCKPQQCSCPNFWIKLARSGI